LKTAALSAVGKGPEKTKDDVDEESYSLVAQQGDSGDDKDSKVSLSTEVGTKRGVVDLNHPLVRKALAMKMKVGGRKLGKGKDQAGVFRLDVNSASIHAALTSAGGVVNVFLGAADIAASSDYTQLSPLFDLVRVTGFSLRWMPVGRYQGPNISLMSPVHQAMILTGDPDAVTSIVFGTLAAQRLLTDSNAHWGTTDDSFLYKYKFPTEKKVVTMASGTLQSALGNWMDTGVIGGTGLVHGGILFATTTNASNVSVNMAYYAVTWHCEWSNRL